MPLLFCLDSVGLSVSACWIFKWIQKKGFWSSLICLCFLDWNLTSSIFWKNSFFTCMLCFRATKMQLNGLNWTCLQIIKQAWNIFCFCFDNFRTCCCFDLCTFWSRDEPWQQNCCDGSRQQNTAALKTLFLFVSIDLLSFNGSREALQSKRGEKKQTSWDFLLRLLGSRLTSCDNYTRTDPLWCH